MEDNSVIIFYSFSLPKSGYMKVRIFLVQIPKSKMLMSFVKVDELPVGIGIFQIGMSENHQRFFVGSGHISKNREKSAAVQKLEVNW